MNATRTRGETLNEVGERIGLSRGRVQQIEMAALGKIRKALRAKQHGVLDGTDKEAAVLVMGALDDAMRGDRDVIPMLILRVSRALAKARTK